MSQVWVQVIGQIMQLIGLVLLAIEWLRGSQLQSISERADMLQLTLHGVGTGVVRTIRDTAHKHNLPQIAEPFERAEMAAKEEIANLARQLDGDFVWPGAWRAEAVKMPDVNQATVDSLLTVLKLNVLKATIATSHRRRWYFGLGTAIAAIGIAVQILGSWPGCCAWLLIKSSS